MNVNVTATRAVALEINKNPAFKAVVDESLTKFLANDWGTSRDKALNDSDPIGGAMGVYPCNVPEGKIWIRSDDYRGSGEMLNGKLLERVITIMFPSDY